MRSTRIVFQKDGSGKSTLSIHLDVAAMRAGQKVAIIDTDTQGSAAWGGTPEAKDPAVVAIAAAEFPGALARSEAFDVTIIDTAPRASASLANIARRLISRSSRSGRTPSTSRPPSKRRASRSRPTRRSRSSSTSCPARALEIAESRTILAELGPVLDGTIGERRIYGRALRTGLAVQEFDPTSDAAREISLARSEIERRSDVNVVAV